MFHKHDQPPSSHTPLLKVKYGPFSLDSVTVFLFAFLTSDLTNENQKWQSETRTKELWLWDELACLIFFHTGVGGGITFSWSCHFHFLTQFPLSSSFQCIQASDQMFICKLKPRLKSPPSKQVACANKLFKIETFKSFWNSQMGFWPNGNNPDRLSPWDNIQWVFKVWFFLVWDE